MERNYLLLTPGPLSTSETVRKAMLQDWCTWDKDYNEGIVTPLRHDLLGIAGLDESEYTTVLLQGSGTYCVEATIGATVRPQDKLLILANGAYGKRMAQIAKSVGAYFMVDMAHIAGLVAAGLHPSPVPYADVVTTTTHKTLRGPRGGLILCRDAEFGKQFNKAIFPGIQGGPLMHVVAAKAVAFKEALSDEFKVYQQQVLDNAKALADELVKKGFRIVSGGTDNHLMLVDLRSKNITGKEAQFLLDEIGITANRNTIPFEPLSPFVTSGIRLGTPALTTRGLKEEDIREVADIIADVIENREDSAVIEAAKAKVQAICKKFPLYEA